MKKIVLENNLILYSFPAVNKDKLGHNIYILINGNEALAIDTGYKRHFSLVLDDLISKEKKVVKVLPSHFHPDHIDGILLLDKPEIYGNRWATDTVNIFYEGEDRECIQPTHTLEEDDIINFGDFTIKVNNAPGHSNCSMIISINNRYLHTGDLYMLSDNYEQVLPYVKYSGIKEHINSLYKIKKSEHGKYLLAHGPCPLNRKDIEIGIENRIKYLKAIFESNNMISVEDALADVTQEFVFKKWRDSV